jgi:hypothetical protein
MEALKQYTKIRACDVFSLHVLYVSLVIATVLYVHQINRAVLSYDLPSTSFYFNFPCTKHYHFVYLDSFHICSCHALASSNEHEYHVALEKNSCLTSLSLFFCDN